MNDNEIKAKFFALYLLQRVYCHDALPENPYILQLVDMGVGALIDNGYLQLRSVSNLKADELRIVRKLIGIGVEECTDKQVIDLIIKKAAFFYRVDVSDYLHSIGILLPFTYLNDQNEPITLTPPQLIEKGWCMIKEKIL